jgi:hypothetical protein
MEALNEKEQRPITKPKHFSGELINRKPRGVNMLEKITKFLGKFRNTVNPKGIPIKRVKPRAQRKRPYHRDAVLEQLIKSGPVTTSEICDMGIARTSTSSSIAQLRKRGWPIITTMVPNPDGETHTQAKYSLKHEKLTPEQQQILTTIRQD